METLYNDEYGSIISYPDHRALEISWSEGSATISDDSFKMWLTKFGELAVETGSQYLIVDGLKWQGNVSPEAMGSWRTEQVIPIYNQAGTKKFAFLFPEVPPPLAGKAPAPEEGANYPTGYFASRDAIYDWFREA